MMGHLTGEQMLLVPLADCGRLLCCNATKLIRFDVRGSTMPHLFKSGDLVVLKSGGPTMTVDTVNTNIFDDDKITGMLCVWFVGEKLERVRFDHRAVEHAPLETTDPRKAEGPSQQALGDYKVVLDEMADAMNRPAADSCAASKANPTKRKPAKPPKNDIVFTS
ncbi:DUF2158 domain-containing protein [Bradyrhizobium sp. JYMT SZCCT0180]|uniref:YodC family protein n=1 Tax=Bradyrhizobium sp. JYMT SZCCT0180 TaxID=2807666 RepID=UPI0032DE629E